jgi:hypothetical protein
MQTSEQWIAELREEIDRLRAALREPLSHTMRRKIRMRLNYCFKEYIRLVEQRDVSR